jgi:hypothetical protein
MSIPRDKGLDTFILFLIHGKLDQASRELWEQSLKDTAIPRLDDFLDFLEQRARTLASGAAPRRTSQFTPRNSETKKAIVNFSSENASCRICKGTHPSYRCQTLLNGDTLSRIDTVKKHNLCFNCLQSGHSISKCPSSSRCKSCGGKHHSLIHRTHSSTPQSGANNDTQKETRKEQESAPTSQTSHSSSSQEHSRRKEFSNHAHGDHITSSLLATAMIRISDGYGNPQLCRAFLDSGATSSFITLACQKRLGLKTTRACTEVLGLTSTSVGNARGSALFSFTSHYEPNVKFSVAALVLPRLTGDLPVSRVDPDQWPHLKGLQLADPHFHLPKPIDILLGSDIFWNLLSDGKQSGPQDAPVAFNSKLGWLVAGPTSLSTREASVSYAEVTEGREKQQSQIEQFPNNDACCTNTSLELAIRTFWEQESIQYKKTLSPEETACEEHFTKHHSRMTDGRYLVKLPLKKSPTELGDSKQMALRRFKQLERRLDNNPKYKQDYKEFMDEYLELGHMSVVKNDDPGVPVNYIPHHFVLKEESTTTKFRVVFDASAKTSSGLSLNDIMMVGPVLQDNLVEIMMRFRCRPIAYTADIAKMYRQIRIPANEAELQRILWRSSPDEPIITYRLDTVSYGTASAPYLATKVLQQLAKDESSSFPLASPILTNDMYVDDLMSGSSDVETAKKEVKEILQMSQKACLSLRKWSSNSKDLLQSIPGELLYTFTKPSSPLGVTQESIPKEPVPDITNYFVSTDNSVKCLGILWDTNTDHFMFRVNLKTIPEKDLTKRTILSEIARLFDPLGWLAPVIISAKIFMQSLWKLEVGWDQPLPSETTTAWNEFKENLNAICDLRIPRCVLPRYFTFVWLAGFCDASERAYSAVVYLCVHHEYKPPSMSMIASKTRVSPAKTVSLPRLELCGAHLLSQLLEEVKIALKLPLSTTRAWSDSTVTLAWIKTCPSKLKTFVANRVTEIISTVPADHWHHIPGINNPADCASRGITPRELIKHNLWWSGPEWTAEEIQNYSSDSIKSTSGQGVKSSITNYQLRDSLSTEEMGHINKEHKSIAIVMTISTESRFINVLIKRKSSLWSLIRVVGWVRRFICVCRKSVQRGFGHLRVSELRAAEQIIIRCVQEIDFYDEINSLQKNKQVDSKSKIANLLPILDENGILRVGGRLRHAPISNDRKHPILLPRHSKLTELIIINKHRELQHAGPQLLLAVLQRRYWIVRGKDAIRFLTQKCVICHRNRATSLSQVMGDLPSARVTPTPAFHSCGVDYAGPFLLKPEAIRSKTTFKAYLCIFVCFSTRAIHLEIASSLSTSAFLAAFKRFVSRRNCPAKMFSDNGTNFVGAAKELKEFYGFLQSQPFNNKVATEMSKKGIEWNFNPPSAPHFGGLWEAGVKSVKFHLHRVLGAARLTYEEMSTLMCQIEASLNSRPLTPVSTNPDDLAALTPSHFLTGTPMTAVPEPDLLDVKTGRLDRWQLVQQMRQQFWNRWSNEYISRLQQRPKWLKQRTVPQVGDLSIIKDDRVPPQQWKLGRITQLYPGSDGLPRVADLKTADGVIRRPIVKLSLLPIENDSISDSV